jgi:hypothetical protein
MNQTMNDQQANAGRRVEGQGTGQLTSEQIEQVRQFIEQAGGAENARRAIEALEKLRPAA